MQNKSINATDRLADVILEAMKALGFTLCKPEESDIEWEVRDPANNVMARKMRSETEPSFLAEKSAVVRRLVELIDYLRKQYFDTQIELVQITEAARDMNLRLELTGNELVKKSDLSSELTTYNRQVAAPLIAEMRDVIDQMKSSMKTRVDYEVSDDEILLLAKAIQFEAKATEVINTLAPGMPQLHFKGYEKKA